MASLTVGRRGERRTWCATSSGRRSRYDACFRARIAGGGPIASQSEPSMTDFRSSSPRCESHYIGLRRRHADERRAHVSRRSEVVAQLSVVPTRAGWLLVVVNATLATDTAVSPCSEM